MLISLWDISALVIASLIVLAAVYWLLKRPKSVARGPVQVQKRSARMSGFTFSVGMALMNLDKFFNGNAQHLIAVVLDEEAEEDAAGEPDDPREHMNRQLRRIRRGEPVDRLVLRLK